MGRSRIHPEGSTASQRVAASTRRLKAAGGARKTYRLKPGAHDALKDLVSAQGGTETDVIEQLLLAEQARRKPIRLTHASAAWSSPGRRDLLEMLPARLANASLLDLIELCCLHGTEIVSSTLDEIRPELPAIQYRMERDMLDNVMKGLRNAA